MEIWPAESKLNLTDEADIDAPQITLSVVLIVTSNVIWNEIRPDLVKMSCEKLAPVDSGQLEYGEDIYLKMRRQECWEFLDQMFKLNKILVEKIETLSLTPILLRIMPFEYSEYKTAIQILGAKCHCVVSYDCAKILSEIDRFCALPFKSILFDS